MNKLTSGLLLCLALGLSHATHAHVIQGGYFAGTNVGTLDILLGQTTGLANSNPTTETNWVNSLLNPDTTFTVKEEKVTYFATESATIFAFQLQASPQYFLIKNSKWWGLFENTASANWGVVDFSLLNSGFKLSDLKGTTISHVSEFGKFPEIKVPEPSSLFLIGLGLIGLGFARKRAKQG